MITYTFEIIVFLFCYLIIFRLNDFKLLRIVAIFINTCLILEVINKIRYKLQEKRNMKIAEEKEKILYKYYKVAKENNENASMIKHDLKNQIQIAYAMESKNNNVINILEDIDAELDKVNTNIYSKNEILNTVLLLKKIEAKKFDINMVYKIDKSISLDSMKDSDVCKLFSNLLDNSIEASKKTDDKKILLKLCKRNDYIVLICENTYKEELRKNILGFLTTKENKKEHGYGIKIIKSISDKYGGEMNIQAKNGSFKVIMVFYIKK